MMLRYCVITVLAMVVSAALPAEASEQAQAPSEPQPAPAALRFFETNVRPLLAEHCYQCHGQNKQQANLRLDSLDSVLRGGDSGPAIVPGHPEQSRLIQLLRHAGDNPQSPPEHVLSTTQIEHLAKWIEIGAPWPQARPADASSQRGRSDRSGGSRGSRADETGSDYWAFEPIRKPTVPKVQRQDWLSNPVDAFILAKLEDAGLEPNPRATKRQLIRRAYFDLIGLPPTPQQVSDFIENDDPAAYEKLIDRLLAMPQYGERWGRHWLDVVRYGQSNGTERDDKKPYTWRYRDYVIRSFNQDKPYDRFVREQIAGDELDHVTRDSIIATGFYRLVIWNNNGSNPRILAKYDELDDILRTTSEGFLGLTIGCARCHDHKFDPISQADYYRMLAFFQTIKPYGKPANESNIIDPEALFTPLESPEAIAAWKARQPEIKEQVEQMKAEIQALQKPAREKLFQDAAKLPENLRAAYAIPQADRTDEQKKLAQEAKEEAEPSDRDVERALDDKAEEQQEKLEDRIEEITKPPFDWALTVREDGPTPEEVHIFIRGNVKSPGEKVEPRFLTVLGGEKPAPPVPSPSGETTGFRKTLATWNGQTTGLRRRLADWIASPDHPLTARVMANRIWQHHFARGIVRTPNNFGKSGIPPTHPLLLDYLASEFIDSGWSVKHMHKLIMTSSAYRMSSKAPSLAAAASSSDPANDLFWRQNLYRLQAEAVRDSTLAVSGELNLKMGGPSFYPDVSRELIAMMRGSWGESPPDQRRRRSVYMFIKRTLKAPMMSVMDYTNTDNPMGRRPVTTVAPQALLLLNSSFIQKRAEAFADRLLRETGDEDGTLIDRAFALTLQRDPTDDERRIARNILHQSAASYNASHTENPDPQAARRRAVESLALVMLNLNEFVYVD